MKQFVLALVVLSSFLAFAGCSQGEVSEKDAASFGKGSEDIKSEDGR